MNNIGRAILVPSCYRRFVRTTAQATASYYYSYAPPYTSINRDTKYTKFVARKYATNINANNDDDEPSSLKSTTDGKRGRRVWRAIQDTDDEWTNISNNKNASIAYLTADGTSSAVETKYWNMAVDDGEDRRLVHESLSRICEQVRIKFDPYFIIMLYVTSYYVGSSKQLITCSFYLAGTRRRSDETKPAGSTTRRST